jgi:NDP-sugar pyrophosphorylase family protein
MTRKPSLLLLAAGMGSRYGSLKQMDGIGPAGEAILDYSVYDAIRAGFGKVVFVIRHSFADDFREVFNAARFGNRIEVDYVFQELDYLPAGLAVPEGRTRPWGTNHAVMMGAKAIDGPFGAINADDFYGADAFAKLGDFLTTARDGEYCMVGYRLENTLSENGTVSRGVCEVSADGYLRSMVERTAIGRRDGRIVYTADGADHELAPQTIVSMNFFGFTPDYFVHSYNRFPEFYAAADGNLKAEFYIPSMVNDLIGDGRASMRVLATDSQWFGVTYKEDKPDVEARIRALIAQGVYPERLWV